MAIERSQRDFLKSLVKSMQKEFHIRGAGTGDLAYVLEEFASLYVPAEDLPRYVHEIRAAALKIERSTLK